MGAGDASGRVARGEEPLVLDASPLIGLDKLGLLDPLRPILESGLVPQTVAHEVSPRLVLPSWLTVRAVTHPPDPALDRFRLDAGEREVVTLALETGVSIVAIDERRGRAAAVAMGLIPIGIAGILLAAAIADLLEDLEAHLRRLAGLGLFVSDAVIEETLRRSRLDRAPEGERL